ncbi:MAG: hypothetical protein RR735_03925, partial [Bacteroidales bacterium]
TNNYYAVYPGTKLVDFLNEINIKSEYPILAAFVDNQLKELGFPLYMAHNVEFIDISHADGRRTYTRSLNFVLQKAVLDLYKKYQLILDYSLPIGLYGKLVELNNNTEKIFPLTVSDIEKIKERMSQIIKANFPIIKTKMNNDEAVALFNSHGQLDKAGLFKNLGNFFIPVYFLDGYGDTFYGPQLYSTGAIDKFDLIKYNDGFCLQSPSAQPPFNIAAAKYQEKLSDVFKENSDWCNIIGVKDIGTVNKAITNGYASKVIQIAEALHERKYAAIADKISRKKRKS